MKSTNRIVLLILAITTNYLNGSQPRENIATDTKTLEKLGRLRKERQEKKLIALGLKKPIEQVAPQEKNPEREKPACRCSGCFSRACKLVFFIFYNTKK